MRKAFFYAITSALAFSIMNVFVKMLGQSMPAAEITFFRGLIGTVAVLGYMRLHHIQFSSNDRGLLTLRGIFGGIGNLLNFIAIAYMTLANVSILFQLSGIFVFIFSTWFLKDPIPKGAGKWLWVILVAVALLVKPWNYSDFHWYSLVAIGGAAFSAAAYTTIRSIAQRGHHSPYEIMFYFLVATMIVGGCLMGQGFVVPDLRESLIIIGIGAISVFAQFFMTGAFIATNAVLAQFLQYIGVFFNAFWGFAIFGENLTWFTVVAGVLMLLSSIMIAKLKEEQPVELSEKS